MSTVKPPIKSFSDMAAAPAFVPPVPQWVAWDSKDLKKEMLNQATVTLRTWLDARLADLIRERVPRGSINISTQGNRTVVRVNGVARFEFKMKVFMEGR